VVALPLGQGQDLDGVYVVGADGTVEWFRWVRARTIVQRVGRFVQRQGLLERDGETS